LVDSVQVWHLADLLHRYLRQQPTARLGHPSVGRSAATLRYRRLYEGADPDATEGKVELRYPTFQRVQLTESRPKVLEKLPNLKLLFTTGLGNASFDMAAATELGIPVCGSHMIGNGTSELTWGLILALLRKIPQEDRVFKYEGGWQTKMGFGVQGKTLGLVGLGRLGTETARVALAFGMKVTAWSANLTEARVSATGLDVSLAPSLESLLSTSDIVSLHLVLSPTTRQIISRARLGLMKPSAFLINTSRGGLIDQDAMCDALEAGTIAGVGLDTFEVEPVPKDARIRKVAREQADRVVITPHIGVSTQFERLSRDVAARLY